jgi:SAM-dependent methyltransferase
MPSSPQIYRDVWSAELYDYRGGDRSDDIPFWLALAKESDGYLLELACGTGRVLLPLARAGHGVTGLDASPSMLAIARRKLEREDKAVRDRVRLVEGDMSGFDLGRQFGLIMIPYRSFQALLERSDQRRCLECSLRHLTADGRLVIDVFQPKLSHLTNLGGVDGGAQFAGPDGATIRQTDHTDFDLAAQRLTWRARLERIESEGVTLIGEHPLTLRYFFRFEVEWMLEACGFEIEALYGDFDRGPLRADSAEMIFVARRK